MIDESFRGVLPLFVRPLIRAYKKLGLTPNHLTYIAFLIALCSATLVVCHHFMGALILWWLGRLLDGTDGIYARETGQISDLGGFLDIVLDMASYGVIILAFFYCYPEWGFRWSVILYLYTLCVTSALALGSIERKKGLGNRGDDRTFRLAAGLAEGGETGIAYTLFLLFPERLDLLTLAWILVLMMTIIGRVGLALRLY